MIGQTAYARIAASNQLRSSTDAPPVLPLLDEVRQQLDAALKEIGEITQRVAEFANSTVGMGPSGASGANTQEPASRGDQVRERLQALSNAIADLRSEVSRLQSI